MGVPMTADPHFIDRDPQAITADIVSWYEEKTGKTLYPAQVERLLADMVAYRESLVRTGIQEAAKQMLVRFSTRPILDYLGELVDVTRLPAQSAFSPFVFSVKAALDVDVPVPAGTRIDGGGGLLFTTDEAVTLFAGSLSVTVNGTCDAAGETGNGWLPGKINNLVDDLGDVDIEVANTETTSGGAEEEDDERLKARIFLAPDHFSTAGPTEAYRFHAMSAHQSIIEVAVLGPELALEGGALISTNGIPPGVVKLYPLVRTGLPDANILERVKATVMPRKVRPLGDFVQVLTPEPVTYAITARLTLYEDADADTVRPAALAALAAYQAARAAGLGRDIVPAQIIAALKVAGVYDIELVTPPGRIVLEDHQWAQCLGAIVTIDPERARG